jgi:hypothetical protein
MLSAVNMDLTSRQLQGQGNSQLPSNQRNFSEEMAACERISLIAAVSLHSFEDLFLGALSMKATCLFEKEKGVPQD